VRAPLLSTKLSLHTSPPGQSALETQVVCEPGRQNELPPAFRHVKSLPTTEPGSGFSQSASVAQAPLQNPMSSNTNTQGSPSHCTLAQLGKPGVPGRQLSAALAPHCLPRNVGSVMSLTS